MSVNFVIEKVFDASREKVFGAMTDLDSFEEWMPNCEGIEKLTEGEVGPGTQWRETRKMYGKSASEVFEIEAMERPEGMTLYVDGKKGATGRGYFRFVHRFEEVGPEKTRVVIEGTMDMENFFFNLFGKLMKGAFKKQMEKDYDALSQYLAKK